MLAKLTGGQKAAIFYALVIAQAVVIVLSPGASTEITMFTPLVATLVMLFVVTRDGYTKAGLLSLGLHRAGLRAWPIAIVGPLLVLGLAYGFVWSTGIATFSTPDVLFEESARLGLPLWVLVPLGGVLVPMFTLGLVTSFGEELGWRGYLLPRLASLGPWRASLLTGLLHAAFHLPIMLLTPLYHPEGNKLIVVPLFLLTVTAVGVFFGYLRLSTNSVWPAVLAHSAHNVLWSAFRAFTATSSTVATEYLAGESGVITLLGYAALGWWLMGRQRFEPASAVQGRPVSWRTR